jgi:hypothetical protein
VTARIRAADGHEQDPEATAPRGELIQPTVAAGLSPGYAAAGDNCGENHGDADELRRRQYSRESAGEATQGEQESEREHVDNAGDRAIAEVNTAIGVRFERRRQGVGWHADTITRAAICPYINKLAPGH